MNVYFFMSISTMSSFSIDFEKTDVIFLEFHEDLNTAEGSSLVDDNLGEPLDILTHNYFNLFLTLICCFIQHKLLNHLRFLEDVRSLDSQSWRGTSTPMTGFPCP